MLNDELSLWLAAAALTADGQEAAAFSLEDLRADVAAGKQLDAAIDDMRRFDRKPGDFGAEIIGPLLIPVVIEAAKQLWSSYLKELRDQSGKQLAALTVDAAKAVIKSVWSDKPDLSAKYAALVRAEAERQGLPSDQVEKLVRTVAGPALGQELKRQ